MTAELVDAGIWLAPNVEHAADRSSWDCLACGEAWPCDVAADALLAAHGDGLPLAAWLWGLYEKAAEMSPTTSHVVLYDRCIRRPLAVVDERRRSTDLFVPGLVAPDEEPKPLRVPNGGYVPGSWGPL